MKKLSNTATRIITATMMFLVFAGCVTIDIFYKNIYAVRWLFVAIMSGAIIEMIVRIINVKRDNFRRNGFLYITFLAWLFLMLASAYYVGLKPEILIFALIVIASADIGAWFFGKLFGGDKMWERLSAHKTWAGQIGGIICGTFILVFYGLLVADKFNPYIFWQGLGISLLSQYGDLTASFIKRKMGIKDFSHILPGHGGILDRFDGWIYVLPLLWLILNSLKECKCI